MLQSRTATWNLFIINSDQSLNRVEPSSTLWNCGKPKKVVRQVAKRACYTMLFFLQLVLLYSAIFLATCFSLVKREIHCKLKKKCYTLQSRTATCNLFMTNSMQSLHNVKPSSTLWNCRKAKKVVRQVAMSACYTMQSSCNLPDKLQRKLRCETLAVELNSTSCNDSWDFLKPYICIANQSSDILQHQQNRPTGDRWRKFQHTTFQIIK